MQQALTEVFGHEALEEPKNKNKLTCLAKRSAEAYEEGTFLEARAQGVISKRKRRPTGKISGAAPVAVVLHGWSKKLPPHARKTRQLFYKKVLHLYEEYSLPGFNRPDESARIIDPRDFAICRIPFPIPALVSVSAPGRKRKHRWKIRTSTEALAPGRNASDVQKNAKYGAPGVIDPMFATPKTA